MSTLVLPDARLEIPALYYPGRKPVGKVNIDWSSPLTKGMLGLWLFNEPDALPVNYVDGKKSSVISSRCSQNRDNIYSSSSNGINLNTPSPFIGVSDDYAWGIDFELLSLDSPNNTVFGNRYEGTSSPLQFTKIKPSGSVEYYNAVDVVLNNSPSLALGRHFIIVAKVGSLLTLYIDGAAISSGTSTKDHDANPVYVGAGGVSGSEPSVINAHFAFHGEMKLTAENVMSINNNPYQFLEPE